MIFIMFSPAPTSSLILSAKLTFPLQRHRQVQHGGPPPAKLGRTGSQSVAALCLARRVSLFPLTTSALKDSLSVLPRPNCIIPLAQRAELHHAVIEAPAA